MISMCIFGAVFKIKLFVSINKELNNLRTILHLRIFGFRYIKVYYVMPLSIFPGKRMPGIPLET